MAGNASGVRTNGRREGRKIFQQKESPNQKESETDKWREEGVTKKYIYLY